MPIFVDPPSVRDSPTMSPRTSPKRWRNLWRFRFPWVKTAVSAPTDDEELLVENLTGRTWQVHLGYRGLGAIAPESQRRYQVVKSGTLSVRQMDAPVGGEYLTAEVNRSTWVVQIYDLSPEGEGVYDLRVLGREMAQWDSRPIHKERLLERMRARLPGFSH